MSFWDEPPPPQPRPDATPPPIADMMRSMGSWLMAPIAAGDAVVARSPSVVLAMLGMCACPDAWGVSIATIRAPGRLPVVQGGMFGMGMPPFVRDMLTQAPDLPPELREELARARDALTIAVRYPDGTVPRFPMRPGWNAPLGGPSMLPGSGGTRGPGRMSVTSYRFTPLPADGVVTVNVSWRNEGIEPAEHSFDSALLREAAGRAIRKPALG